MSSARPEYWLDREGPATLCELFAARVAASPEACAYRFYSPRQQVWHELTWRQAASNVALWRRVLHAHGVQCGDRVAIMLRNSPEWLCVDQAVMSLGAITVGLFCDDTPPSNAHLLADSGASVLVAYKAGWVEQVLAVGGCELLTTVLVFSGESGADPRWTSADTALDQARELPDPVVEGPASDDLASLIYTSGSQGRALGAMLSHANLLSNAQSVADVLPAIDNECALSHVPLAHSYERVADAYRAMITGACIVFCRHPRFLGPTLAREPITTLIGVPRIYERFYVELTRWMARKPRLVRRLIKVTVDIGESVFERSQGRSGFRPTHLLWPLLRVFVARRRLRPFGSRIQVAVSGAAALPYPVARTLTGLGLPILQGYGLTEAGPVVSVNRVHDNALDSVGLLIDDVSIKMGPDNELLVRSPGVMRGYWNNEEATARMLAAGGWLHTGDKVSRLDARRLYLTGRMKEVIVLSSGEKASPEPIETALQLDSLVTRAIVVGEARPVLAAVISCPAHRLVPIMRRLELDPEQPANLRSAQLENYFIKRFSRLTESFPVHAQIRRVVITTDSWTQSNGLLTPTGKIRRRQVARCYAHDIGRLYGRRVAGEKSDVSQNTNLG